MTHTEEDTATFLVDEGYEPYDIIPLVCIQTGSRAYGLSSEESDRDYIGVHLMSTWACLEHPDFRSNIQVIRKRFNENLEEMPPGEKGGAVSLDSFEMWKFITLWTKGAPIVYELLYMPPVHLDENSEYLFSIMREGVSNRLGKAVRGMVLHNWRKKRTNRKETIIAYYRLIQTIHLLVENEFVWRVEELWDYIKMDASKDILTSYLNPDTRKTPLSEEELAPVALEIASLVDEVDKAMIITKLPDQVPRKYLDSVLQKVKKTRSILI